MSEEKKYESLKQEIIEQWSHEELVKFILRQQKLIERLEQEIERLREKQPSNSQTSSKPPSSELIQKSEKAKEEVKEEGEQKRSPGGQPGHIGKTRKGFGRVDRFEISYPSVCSSCGSKELSEAIGVHKEQIACLVARPIEVVEFQRVKCQCLSCGALVCGAQANGIISGQALNVSLQTFLVWLGNYGHMSYEKQQELVWELGEITIGRGTLNNTNERIAVAVEPAVEALWEWAPLQPNVHVDETPWCVMGVKEWLWTASA